MLYVILMKAREGKLKDAIARRLQWNPPEGMQVLGEYWVQSAEISCIAIFEGDHIAPMLEFECTWEDVFEITFIPAVSAQDGMEVAKKMMG